jgi:Ni/Co efflux regulator RcnB
MRQHNPAKPHHPRRREMKKLVLAAVAATFAVAATLPASAEEGRHQGMHATKKVVIHRDRGRHEGWRHRDVKKVIIHRDNGRHEGWRHSRHGGNKVVVIKKKFD